MHPYKKLWHITKMENLYMSEYFLIYKSNMLNKQGVDEMKIIKKKLNTFQFVKNKYAEKK